MRSDKKTLLRGFLSRSYRFLTTPAEFGAFVGVILLVLTGLITYWAYTVSYHDEHQETFNAAVSARDQLEITLLHGLSATQSLAFCVEQDILPKNFDSIAVRLITVYKTIDAIELAPDGIVKYTYPLEENRKAVGFNILADPMQKWEAIHAVQNRGLVFAGPLNLVQSGLAVVGRNPVFLVRNGQESFWGFAVVIIRIPTLLRSANLDDLAGRGYAYRLSKVDRISGAESPFVQSVRDLQDPVSVSVDVPNGKWSLALTPINGWKARTKTIPIAIFSVLLSILGGVFVWYLARQPEVLKRLVERRAAELVQSEQRFRTLIEDAPVSITISRGGVLLYANPRMLQMIGLTRLEEIAGRKVTEFMTPESQRLSVMRREALTAGLPAAADIDREVVRSDGAMVPVNITIDTVTLADGPADVAFITDCTERNRSREQLQNSLLEKELLLKEIHHRVKNNLQVISSLLSLQSQVVTDPHARETYAESIRRVRAMALVHEKLYRSDNLAHVNFSEYLKTVVVELSRSIQKEGVTFSVEAEQIMMGIDLAVPCGLIANELVSNALKHGFVGRREGNVVVTFKRTSETMLQLSVSDNGIGFSPEADYRTINTMGMNIVRALTDQISGVLTLEQNGQTAFTLIFPG